MGEILGGNGCSSCGLCLQKADRVRVHVRACVPPHLQMSCVNGGCSKCTKPRGSYEVQAVLSTINELASQQIAVKLCACWLSALPSSPLRPIARGAAGSVYSSLSPPPPHSFFFLSH